MIRQAEGHADIETARALFQEYAASLDFALDADPCFVGFDGEVAALPGDYAPPRGRLLLAPGGCVALRDFGGGTCEMKRLYVQPAFRGTGLGRRLAHAVVREARSLGYERMRLDTLERMEAARALYRAMGFVDIARYNDNTLCGAVFLEMDLTTLRVAPLLAVLERHDVAYVLNGSVAAMARGVGLTPGDLDIAPELSAENLVRVAAALDELSAKPKFVPTWKKGPSREFCDSWRPDPPSVEQLDHRFVTAYGELDVVPSNGGSYAELAPRAEKLAVFGAEPLVANPADVIAFWRKWDRPKDRERIAALEGLRHFPPTLGS